MKPVSLAIVGSTGYASELIKRIWTLPRLVKLVAMVALNAENRFVVRCRDAGVRVYSELDEMLAEMGPEIDAILNPTPIHLHARIAKKCLLAGIPVLQEKPPVATVQELDSLTVLSNELRIPVAVCFNSIYSHLVQNLKQELVAGKYGTIRGIRSIGGWIRTTGYFSRNEWAGRLTLGESWVLDGSLNNPLAHLLANSLYLASGGRHTMAEPSSVTGELYRANKIESEDTSSLRVITRDGVPIVCNFTLCSEAEIPPTTVLDTEQAEIEIIEFKEVRINYRGGGFEHRESYKEDRIEMFESLCHSLVEKQRFLLELKTCRPFTVAVNAAFDSCGVPLSVPEEFISVERAAESSRTVIRGINDAILSAHASGLLLSECGVPWATPSQIVTVERYDSFPGPMSKMLPFPSHANDEYFTSNPTRD